MQRFITFESETSKWPATSFALFTIGVLSLLHRFLVEPLLYGRLSHVPGPKLAGLSWYYLSWFDMRLHRNEKIGECKSGC